MTVLFYSQENLGWSEGHKTCTIKTTNDDKKRGLTDEQHEQH